MPACPHTSRFIVLTGGPGSGKTTLIEALRRLGLAAAPEAGRAIIKEQQEAWNRGDAERLAARFHEQSSFTNVRGDFYIGAEAFKERHDLIFRTIFKGSEHALNIQRLHFPTQHVAIVDIEAAVPRLSRMIEKHTG